MAVDQLKFCKMASKKKEGLNAALTGLYAELNTLGQADEYEKIIKISNKILSMDKTALKALQYKIISLINLGRFDEALKQMSNSAKLASSLHFEKAYCLYRLNQNQEALEAISQAPEQTLQLKELKAQLFYKLDRFQESHQTYREVIKNTDDDFNDERMANLAAVLAQLAMTNQPVPDASDLGDSTYELVYNAACRLLAAGRYQAAERQLARAADLCRHTLREDGADDDEVDQETAVIDVQRAYCLQRLGRPADAALLYHETLKKRPSDGAVLAVAANNIVCINGDQNVFDSKKRMRAVTAEGAEAKLAGHQRRVMAVNQCLFSLLTHQGEALQKQLSQLTERYPEEAVTAALIRASAAARKSPDEAVRLLSELRTDSPQQQLLVQLAQVQLLVGRGQLLEASRQLGALGDLSRRPGVVSTRVALCVRAGSQEAAAQLLQEAVRQQAQAGARGDASQLWRQSADFSLRCGEPRAAAASLEELRRAQPGDVRTVAQLVTAYSQFDPAAARRVSAELPPPQLGTGLDVDALESTSWSAGGRPRRKDGLPSPGSPSSPDTPGDALIQNQNKKRKKKKPKLPKNYNPKVKPDPERWLPRRERSTFKQRKRRRNEPMKGTQGGPSAQSDLYDITKTAVQQKAAPLPDQTAGPRQMARNAQKKKKQNKKKW
ncbi:signal recognition particle subunit SRP72-like isoform X2 [Amphibalanus amphitrite]|uniref:signal recognition particle subunit SRP72-like isoform X2 n=2 Tax=Amphibalanus amphitrite TaxID=1232801 RepID=UPI001C9084A8|nr:signal recognition particle subunit SRP72-like isoform X2 [Amphibalanus amphitrite]